MRQLALQLIDHPEPTLANFVISRNAELAASLHAAITSGQERFIYLWGARGSGRTHLLKASVAAASALGREAAYLAAPMDPEGLARASANVVLAIDDAQCLGEDAQIALFAAYNRILDGTGALIAAGNAPPQAIGVRADLATRLAWGLVYEVHALTDADKAQAMTTHAAARGFALPADVVDYLLRHARRDLATLIALVDALDRRSLEARRQITVPLACDVLRETLITEDRN